MVNPLAKLEKAHTILEQAKTVDEVKDIRDKAEALRLYTKQANMGLESQYYCAEIKIRAERRAGELLRKTVKAGNPQLSSDKTIGLDDIGVSRDQSSRWQQMAELKKENGD